MIFDVLDKKGFDGEVHQDVYGLMPGMRQGIKGSTGGIVDFYG
ncbi:MAG: hypothetical protein PHH11_11475 [Methylomonas sp.]|nr:hypothetical protein [Methylomonas sp.]